MPEYLLPDVGEGLIEAEIVSWKVKVGDTVDINDVVVEIETAKSLVELPSPYAGTVSALLVAEGETVAVGTPIIAIGAPGEAPAPAPAAPMGGDMVIDLSNPAASGGGEGESLVGRNKAERGPMRRPRKGSASPSTEAAAATQMQVQGAFAPGGARSEPVVEADEPAVPATTAPPLPVREQVLAKPPVRRLAKDLGVDLASVTPTGPHGTVTRADVEQAASGAAVIKPVVEPEPAVAMPAAYADLGRPGVHPMAGARETREPVKGVRRAMAQAMTQSAFTSPHVTEWVTVDVTATMRLVERLRSSRDLRGVKVSPLLVLARAAMLAMRRTPEINSWWDEAAQEVVLKGYVNLGIAAATPRGLVVPNIKDADAMSLVELAGALEELTDTARQGRTQPAEMSGGTFTITNVGVFGIDAGTPIINPGESAILCFGAIAKRPWVDEETGEIVARDVTTLALSFDHRHIDGEKGSRFLADVASILRDPANALLF
ncbi:2-oxo acid dehydrogenase subunit E2 [Nocardioides sp. zg-579]|uniref:Dihydrolipoamide acetyltransferase component of pyruvate dehydrogenase complex n=1 Tax=Nocardioides marmotae TaxID=2663857 RepID=A0A6I3JF30_9ACTN|nr:dihydrolipoamide acetyltransferase family protein [Nocardioides marmotae]MCR6033077.1 2-oxo acid dehydrogenase subunit E2 [Gordonia jinghuaiqii]MTB96729.1 2-oxo acid dehydrogenase subunit E2 [Nocardioides marmotae]QKE03061.1 2-oxo acid dehydrogenase subunit E2 [Nocardioides marmotae]